MNFISPRQASGGRRLSLDDNCNNDLGISHAEEAMPQTPHIKSNKCSDPPISTYDSPDSPGSTSSDASQRARRRRLREISAQSDDCWEANLSDDENENGALPLEWNSSLVRRQMMRKGGMKDDTSNGELNGIDLHLHNSPSNDESEGMSLPEQLLEKRLRRKERLHKKHEQSARSQQRYQQRQEARMQPHSPNRPSISHLTGRSGSEIRGAATPLFPDEEFDDDNASTAASPNKSYHEQNETDTPAAALGSLPQRRICPPLPDEADRKRIVGCLAAVLASSYPYETVPHLLVKETQIGKGVPIEDYATKTNNDEEQAAVPTSVEISDTPPSEEPCLNQSGHDRVNTNIEVDTKNSQDQSCNAAINGSHPHLQQHKRQQDLIQQSRESQRPPTTPFNSFMTSFQKNKPPSFKHSNSTGDVQPKRPSPASNPMSSLQHSFSFASFNNNNSAARIFDKAGSQNPPPSLAVELAEIRHRIRRHSCLSELLISSAEMLMLDPSHAKAFLPMLETLLTKVEVPTANDGPMDKSSHSMNSMGASGRQSWKGRGFGGGGVHHPEVYEENQSSISTQRPSSTVHSTSVTTTQPNDVASAAPPHTSSNDTHLKEGNDTEKQSSCPSSRPATPQYAPLDTAIVEKDLVAPFLQTLTPGAGFRCIALLLLNHLLRDGRGYDARVRQAFKRLAVIVLSHEIKVGGILCVDLDDEEGLDEMLWGDRKPNSASGEDESFKDADELALLATRKFEAMEHAIATKLIAMSGNTRSKEPSASTRTAVPRNNRPRQLSRAESAPVAASSPSSSTHGPIALAPKETPLSSQHGISKEQILRGLKVSGAGALGATLFALTGGLAAPGIAAGLAAVAGSSAIAAGVSTVLSSTAAITTIFGFGGAGLASYKMHRRTKGLTEFDFHKEGGKDTEAELFSTVCISGWLRDARDFQRPWGVTPSHPRIVEKQELLERFYFIYNPGNVLRVGEILKHWKGRYFQLWRALREKYGRDPSNLFPLEDGPRISAELTHEEGEAVDFLLDELGYLPNKKNSKGSSARPPKSSPPSEAKRLQSVQQQLKDSSMRPKESFGVNIGDIASSLSLFTESETSSINENSTHTAGSAPNTSTSNKDSEPAADAGNKSPPKHLLTVWDYHANYGGELYTVQWESELLMELCDSVTDQMIEWGISATKTILHTTVFATLMTAVTLPYSLVLAANAIDSSWTMAMERADRAGVELAKSLVDSTAGHRPVTLAGMSTGARVIYSCLKELAKHQEIWEAQQQKKKLPAARQRHNGNNEEERKEDELKYLREPASIVEDVILMGTPNHVSLKSWEACRRVVAGRLINCYSRKDLILSLMFQMKRFQGMLRPVCGTSPVAVNGVENYDVTDLVSAHTDYCLVAGEILARVRHGQPQTAAAKTQEVYAMVTTINVANNKDSQYMLASLSDEAVVQRGR